ncbi:MAG: CxxxxCH/CxxCH domain-containing protein [Deltaproteobacteria bacterium]|nr:CxxxxCH/CxxCH domain-containing protein [Deltaproteobacteria bacterium]
MVDGTQAACGTCHGTPPLGTHPRNSNCSVCHPTMGAGLTIVDAARHINGVVDVDLTGVSCTDCHGSAADGTPAPPQDTTGNTATAVRGVGAHRSHLGTSGWHKEVVCTDCHLVPASVTATGHIDTALPAELTWGALATADGATPTFSGTSCSVYCHGQTLQPGGTNITPTWTTVNGSQAACGTCHGLPPGGTHVTVTDCSMCHPTTNASGTIIQPAIHINGTVELVSNHPAGWSAPTSHGMTANNTGFTNCQACHGADLRGGVVGVSCESCHPGWQTDCTFCHGGVDNATGAPPAAVDGRTGRNTIAVGAHTEHVGSTSMHVAWDCTRCHNPKPTSALSPGHIDGDGQAEVIFDWMNPSATYDPATGVCANLYCHGNGSSRLGTADWNTNPTLQCDSCHAYTWSSKADLRAMSGKHEKHVRGKGIACVECHATVVDSSGNIIGLPLHVNGQPEVSLRRGGRFTPGSPPSCNPACHGNEVWL